MQPSLLTGKALTLWRSLIIVLLLLIIVRFVVAGQSKVLFNTISSDGDESAFLSLGLAILEAGQLTDGARPPLYPLLLSTMAERDWTYFTNAKMVTLALGVVAIVATFAVGVLLFGWEVGLLAAFLLAANKEFHLRASTVYTDVLFVSIFLGAWYFLIKSFKGWVYCILAGIFTGLTYLTKGSGPILILAWGAVALFHYRRNIFRHKELLLVPLFFVMTGLPLMIYNYQTFGDPLYSLDTAHVLWMDSWGQTQLSNPADMPTMATYFQTHTPADIVERVQNGAIRLTKFLPFVLLPSRRIEPGWLVPVLLTGAVFIVGAVLVWRREWVVNFYKHHYIMLLLSLLLFAFFYFFLSWYAKTQVESRFVLPLLPPIYLLVSVAVVGLVRRLGVWAKSKHEAAWRAYIIGIAAIIIWAIIWLVQTTLAEQWSLTVDPYASDRQANLEVDAVMEWLNRDYPQGDVTVMFGPAKSLPLWKFPARFNFERIPIDMDTWPKFTNYLAGVAPDYIILDSDTVRRRRAALGNYFWYQEDVGMEIKQIPAKWALIYLHNESPHTWAIFEPVTPPDAPLANFGDKIKLLDYAIIPPQNSPDNTLRVALYWRGLTALPEDYIFFVHLTALDGYVLAQQDQPPFNRLWPTHRWVPGDILADRFEIPVGDWIQPGDYLLLAGLYNPQTGERLPLVSGSASPSPEAVLLEKIQLK